MDKAHEVGGVGFRETVLCLRVDGKDYEVDVAQLSTRLAAATQEQRANCEISPAGYGIHWPDVDEDLSIDGLIGVRHVCPLADAAA
jgi:hypothetical protein